MTISPDRLIQISDADDDRIADFRKIRERDLVGREGRFIAEGTVVLRMLARSSTFEAEKILLLENRVDGVADLLEEFGTDVPIMVCSRGVIDAVAGFPMHRGVLAVGRAHKPPGLHEAVDGLGEDALVLVCNAISNHDNLGGLLRNAAAFSVDLVCLDAQCCDPLYRKSIRVSVGTALTVPYAREGNIEEIVRVLDGAGFDILALSPEGRVPIQQVQPARRTALLVGTEGEGLPKPLLEKLNTVRIPQAGDLDSLNVATAAGIALFCAASAQGRVD
ncbi:TrmH family RNA methyltransferase [Hoeflea sp. TYP-13]|uniref:TrmH family RNA methyltransferase n=1 Tax=Hoeflea sp. TYP-13 TaxID=3230023 RepID=UPI0034C66256